MFKTLLKQIGDYKRDAVLTPIFVILEVIMEVIIPMMMAAIIDYGLTGQSLRTVCLIGAAMIVMAGLTLFFGVESGRTASSASSGFAMNLRQAMYERIQTFSFSNIDKFSTAGLVTRMTTDVMNVQQAFQMSLPHGDDLPDPSTLCADLFDRDHLPGSRACPDFIQGKPDFKKSFP